VVSIWPLSKIFLLKFGTGTAQTESNNSGTAKVKIVKKERDPPLFTRKQLTKFKKILRNTTQVIV
jgi:hypothetical protein